MHEVVATDDAERPPAGAVVIRFLDDERVLTDGAELVFGRAGDLVVDQVNPYLHRQLGRIARPADTWILSNVGASLTLVVNTDRRVRTELLPGADTALLGRHHLISFRAGQARYEVEVERVPDRIDRTDVATETTGTTTKSWGFIELNTEQQQLLAVLAERRLVEGSFEMPTNAMAADRLGWSVKKFGRKLDHLCGRLSAEGVGGLAGERGTEAADRRQRLVEHAIAVGLITPGDVARLPERE